MQELAARTVALADDDHGIVLDGDADASPNGDRLSGQFRHLAGGSSATGRCRHQLPPRSPARRLSVARMSTRVSLGLTNNGDAAVALCTPRQRFDRSAVRRLRSAEVWAE